MLNSSLYDTLPSLINGIGQRHFYDQVAYSIKALDPISNIRIVSYSKTNHPIFLSSYPMSEIDKMYCKSAYLLDPVYDMICGDKNPTELFTLDSLVNDDFRDSIYYDTFYQRLGWCNETNIVIGTNDETKICIVYSTKDNDASIQAVNRELIPCISSIKAAILTHERVGRLLPQNQTIEHENTTHKSHHSHLDELNLTKREKEIVGLILKGMSSVSIAKKCFVSEGTVKNHRKNIYRKLKIKSQAELFRNFIQ
ncbi:helix-turn-helix domain-containing protein [Marinomonas shanghaiensis]|uniref:helix-turn-helix domain-containing protein n=1 Tax=Marinomonas shanghaiensis TaxID=2202418 RepID=UPI003A9138D1